jgi:pimeloyl-ACP methyl ester carboxylesterase
MAPGRARPIGGGWQRACRLTPWGRRYRILPSHRHRSAGRSDDVHEVEAAIRAAAPPVVVAGWSYGGAVIDDLAGTGPIGWLVYVASVPEPAGAATEDEPADLASLPHLLFPDCPMTTGGLPQQR